MSSVRAGLSPREVTFEDLISLAPFGNNLTSMEFLGFAIRKALEFSVSKILRVLQVSLVKVVYDLNKEPFNKIVDLK